MRLFPRLLVAFSFGFAALGAGASPANPVEGVDYRVLDKAQPTDSGKKVEVTEFFWYSCPHCNAFEPQLNDWVKKQGDNIVYKRVPVAFRDSFIPQQKLYYTLEAMGKVNELHDKVFHAIHVEHKSLDKDDAIADFIAKQGVDKAKFLEIYNSFGVQTKVRRAAQLQQDYKIDGVPTVAIAGRYLTSPSIVSASMGNAPEQALQTGALQVMSWLVAKAAKEGGASNGQAAPAKTVQSGDASKKK